MSTQRLIAMFGWALAGIAGCADGGDSGPATCKDARSAYKISADGPQTLYLGGDKTLPWPAFCVGMASDSPTEFVELPAFDASGRPTNYSGFTEAALSQEALPTAALDRARIGFSLITHYDKVRIDPVDLTLDITAKTFTRSEAPAARGPLVSRTLANMEISYMPYGVAMECGQQLDALGAQVSADANIDLGGLPFELDDDQMCTTAGNNSFVRSSANPAKSVTFHAQGVTSGDIMTCGRASVRCLPDPTANGQVGGQTTIQLRYASPTDGARR